MVRNTSSSYNLRGSTSRLSLRSSQTETPTPAVGNPQPAPIEVPTFLPVSAVYRYEDPHCAALNEADRRSRPAAIEQTTTPQASTSSLRPSTKVELLKHIEALRVHHQHFSNGWYVKGSCACNERIKELDARETDEAVQRVQAVLELRAQKEKEKEKVVQEREQSEMARREAWERVAASPIADEDPPQSTLFSKFNSNRNNEKQMHQPQPDPYSFELHNVDTGKFPELLPLGVSPDSPPQASLYDNFVEEAKKPSLQDLFSDEFMERTNKKLAEENIAEQEAMNKGAEGVKKRRMAGLVFGSANHLAAQYVPSDVSSSFRPLNFSQFSRQAPAANHSGDVVGMNGECKSLIAKGLEVQAKEQNVLKSPEAYTQPFCEFLTENPTVWHAVQYFEKKLDAAGFKKLSERQTWTSTLEKGGKYYIARNGSSLIAFTVGQSYKSGNGVAMIAGHVDALTARLKPVSTKTTKAGYVQLGVAPYAGALNTTWWDRDLGIGGRVLVKDETTGKIETKLVKLGWPIARIPTLAPHFGVGMIGSNNAETEAVPIIGLDYSSPSSTSSEFENLTLGGAGSFFATQPPKLVGAIAGELSIQDYSSIVNWELELYDTQPAQVGGLEKEFIFAGRIDDKLCSWSAIEGLLASAASSPEDDGIVKLVGVFDDEEIGSLLRQGARGNFLPSTIERITESFGSSSANILSQTYANSFLISADVTHAVNPNFLSKYLENHAPRLNVGLVVSADSNGHMTTDSVSTALLTRVAEKSKCQLQSFMIRNDSRSGGTVGPMLSSAMGVRAIDAGIPQLSMHSIRATTGALDPGLGVKIFKGFFDSFESVDKEFE